jgi:soluble lytic murein transglycosylase-like protein
MSLFGRKIRTSGIIMSRPMGFTLLFIYFVHVAAIIWLIRHYTEQQNQILEQKKTIEELQQKLKILDIIQEYQIGFTKDETDQLTEVVWNESQKFGIDPLLIMAVIIAESSFKKHQIAGEGGGEGLMQVKPSTARTVAERWGIKWPQQEGLANSGLNIRVGTAYLFELILKFKDIKKAIIAYNMGESVTREYFYFGAAPPARYYNKVKRIYQQLRERFENG